MWSADKNDEWTREKNCNPVCFWLTFLPMSHELLQLWALVGTGERVDDSTVHYAISWEAFSEFWAGHEHIAEGATRAERRRDLARWMVEVRNLMGCSDAGDDW